MLGALAMVAGLFGPVGAAKAQAQTFTVQVGAFLEGAPAESMRFFPGVLNVHKGDTIKFVSESFHTATLLPKGQHPIPWWQNNQSFGGPWGLYTPDPDEGTDAMKVNNRVLFPSRQDCGAASQPACDFDGTGDPVNGVLNSGLPLGGPMDFSVRIQANPGDIIYAMCLIHPHMFVRINVVADNQPTSTQAAVDAGKAATVAKDTDWATSAHARLNKPSSHETADGTKVWDVYAGYDNHFVSLYAMYPRRMTIRRGQTVRFHFDALVYELHTASMPISAAREELDSHFAPGCDADGDQGTAPDNPPETEGPPFCNNPQHLEFDLNTDAMLTRGDGTFTGGNDFESSGERGAHPTVAGPPFAGDASFDVTFTKVSGDDPYKYLCLVHPFMKGRIAVKRAR